MAKLLDFLPEDPAMLQKAFDPTQCTPVSSLTPQIPSDQNLLQGPWNLKEDQSLAYFWGDDKNRIKKFQYLHKEGKLSLAELEQKMQRIQKNTVWIKIHGRVQAFSPLEIFLANLGRGDAFFSSHDDFETSYLSWKGPFFKRNRKKVLAREIEEVLTAWLHFQNVLPQRDFRLQIQGKILLRWGKWNYESVLVDLTSISKKGVLGVLPEHCFLEIQKIINSSTELYLVWEKQENWEKVKGTFLLPLFRPQETRVPLNHIVFEGNRIFIQHPSNGPWREEIHGLLRWGEAQIVA